MNSLTLIPAIGLANFYSILISKNLNSKESPFNHPILINENKSSFHDHSIISLNAGKYPKIIGDLPYDSKQISSLLSLCSNIENKTERLNQCASSIKSKLVIDGYITTQVFIDEANNAETLEIIKGKVYEIIVDGKNKKLNKRVKKELESLRFSHLNINTIENKLRYLNLIDEIKVIKGKITKLGGDLTKSTLRVSVIPIDYNWKGLLSFSNDGTSGSGNIKNTFNLKKKEFLLEYDSININNIFQFSGTNLGKTSYSISYSFPLTEKIDLINSFSRSNTKLIELVKPINSFETLNNSYIFSLKYNIEDSFKDRSSLYLTTNYSLSNNYLEDKQLPEYLQEILRKPTSTFISISWDRFKQEETFSIYSKLYFSQAIKESIPKKQLQELESNDIHPEKARAIGASVSLYRPFTNSIAASINLGGQHALNPLIQTMKFGLGSDQGLFGTPSQIISGDSGWNTSLSLRIKTLKNKRSSFYITPFIGIGSVASRFSARHEIDNIGSTGILLSQKNKKFSNEIGLTKTFWTENNKDGIWDKWDLGHGVYYKTTFFF